MSENLTFDFCIIPNPFSREKRNIIFVTKNGCGFLDTLITESSEYIDVKEIIEQFGYKETIPLHFESSSEDSLSEVKNFLEDCGLKYSRELEINLIRDLNILKDDIRNSINNSPIPTNTKNKLIESKKELFKFKYPEPKIGGKVTLYFYLFLEFGFNNNGKPIIQLNGDFKDSQDSDGRNYIRIVKSDFERFEDNLNPNSIMLKSCKNQSDLFKEIGILYSGYFKYQQRIEKGDALILQEKKYPYKFTEIKKFLIPNQCINAETNRMSYDKLITLSKKIKNESVVEGHQYISSNEIQLEAEELEKFLSNKINSLSEKEEFEEAAMLKKEVDFIHDKIEKVKSLNKNGMTTEEYFKFFSVS